MCHPREGGDLDNHIGIALFHLDSRLRGNDGGENLKIKN